MTQNKKIELRKRSVMLKNILSSSLVLKKSNKLSFSKKFNTKLEFI